MKCLAINNKFLTPDLDVIHLIASFNSGSEML